MTHDEEATEISKHAATRIGLSVINRLRQIAPAYEGVDGQRALTNVADLLERIVEERT